MAVTFRLPDVGEGVAEAEVIRWLVSEGEQISADQPVVEVQTDKAMVELPSPVSGRVAEIRWREGEVVPVGEVLLVVDTGEKQGKVVDPAVDQTEETEKRVPVSKKKGKRRRVPAAPSTRRLARELGIDINEVEGTGPQGRVTDEDVIRFTQRRENKETKLEETAERVAIREVTEDAVRDIPIWVGEEILEEPLSKTRRVIAERLTYSATKKPHVTHFDELNVDGLVAWREQRKKAGQSFSYLSFLLKAIAVTLTHYPTFNAHFDEEKQVLRRYSSISMGVATDTPRGLLVPVISHVEQKSIAELSREIAELKEATLQGTIAPAKLRGSTFTVSNAGSLGGQWATPIINPPEVGILAIHPIERKPVVQGEQIVLGWRMNVSLSFDHRILDGADAIRFTEKLNTYTMDPGQLLAELT